MRVFRHSLFVFVASVGLAGILQPAVADQPELGWSCSANCNALNSAGETQKLFVESGTTAAGALSTILTDCNSWCSSLTNADTCGIDGGTSVTRSCVKN